jgi:hypothetical protein
MSACFTLIISAALFLATGIAHAQMLYGDPYDGARPALRGHCPPW